MKNRLLLSVFTIMACTSAAMAEEEATTYPLVLTGLKVDNTTMTTTVVRNGTTVTLGSGSAVSVGETLTFTYTPNEGYYFSDGTNSAKTTSLVLTAGMVSSGSTESIDITGATFTTDSTWTEVISDGTDVAPSISNTNYYTRTDGWKVNFPRTDQDSKTISAAMNESGTLLFDYGVNNGFTAYGTFHVYLYINNTQTAQYDDFMSEDASLSESEKYRKICSVSGVEVTKDDTVKWVFKRESYNWADDDGRFGYLGGVKLTPSAAGATIISPSLSLTAYAVHQHEYGNDGKCTTCGTAKTYTLSTIPTSDHVTSTVVKLGSEALSEGTTLTYNDALTVTVTKQSYAAWSDDATITSDERTFTITVGSTDPNTEIAEKVALAVCNHTNTTSGVCNNCGHYDALTDNDKVDGYYQISSVGNLIAFADIVNGTNGATKNSSACALVTEDIDASSVSYTPIGNSDSNAYTGTFDGGSHTIKLNIDNDEDYQGLFGCANKCTIKNVTVEGTVSGTSFVGGIVGVTYSDTITNCHNKATVTGESEVGGIVGNVEGTTIISECTNYGAITDTIDGGGIVGVSTCDDLTLTKCINEGTVTGDRTGGLVGLTYTPSTIENCANRGTVTGDSEIGSLVGYIYGNTVLTGCYNSLTSSLPTFGTTEGDMTLTRCYDINSTSTRSDTIQAFTSDELKSGALCYKLNGGAKSEDCWYQKLTGDDADAHPMLTAKDEEANVVNYIRKDSEESYFNTGSENTVSNSDAKTFCVVDATEKAKRNITIENENVNVLVNNTDGTFTCANTVLEDGTSYSVDYDYTATKFTYERTLSSAGINTFILPAAISAGSVNGTVYKLKSYDGTTLTFDEIATTDTLEANTPYLVQTENAKTSLLAGTLDKVPVSAMSPVYVTTDGGATHIGSYSVQKSSDTTTDTNYTYYGYTKGSFVKASSWTLNPFRTMITITSSNSSSAAKSLNIQLGDEVTGIVSPSLESSSVDVYTASGVKVRSQADSATALQGLPNGIYIVGGRKVVKNK